ncbi:hypothetical protein V6U77_06405 [Micromonospora sp. CPCC 205546]
MTSAVAARDPEATVRTAVGRRAEREARGRLGPGHMHHRAQGRAVWKGEE